MQVQGKGKDLLRRVQELFCLKEPVLSSGPTYDPEIRKIHFS